jgi:branched-chain amino acid transport system substrate-binding protein
MSPFAKRRAYPFPGPARGLLLAGLLLAGCVTDQTVTPNSRAPLQTTASHPAPKPAPAAPQTQTQAPPPAVQAPVATAPVLRPPLEQKIEVQKAPVLKLSNEAALEPIRVGLLLPLSGAPGTTELGQELLDAATMALFEIGGQRLELLPRDTGGTAEGAQAAALDAIQSGATLLLGPLFRTSVQAAAPVARERGIPIIALSSDVSVAGDGVFLLSFTPEQEVRRAVGYAIAQGLTRFAALAPANDYGRAVVNAMHRYVEDGGGVVIRTEFYADNGSGADEAVKSLSDYDARRDNLLRRRQELTAMDNDWARQQLKALENIDALGDLPIDAVLLPEGGRVLRAVAPLLPYYDMDLNRIRLIGTGRWDDPTVGREPTLIGGWFAGADRETVADFRRRFRARFNHAPARIASLAYDATALAAVLAERDDALNFSVDLLTDDNGFVGTDGLFRFRANGLAERGLAVLEVRRDDFRIVDPAPRSFENLIN